MSLLTFFLYIQLKKLEPICLYDRLLTTKCLKITSKVSSLLSVMSRHPYSRGVMLHPLSLVPFVCLNVS